MHITSIKDDTRRYGNKGSGKSTQCYIGWAEYNGAKVPIELWSPEDTLLLNTAGYETDWKHGEEYRVDLPVEVEDRKGKWRIVRVQGVTEDRWFTHKDAQKAMLRGSGAKLILRGNALQVGDIIHRTYEVTGKLPQGYRLEVLSLDKRNMTVKYLDPDSKHAAGEVVNTSRNNAFTYTVERSEQAELAPV